MGMLILWTLLCVIGVMIVIKVIVWWIVRSRLPQADLIVLTHNSAQRIEGVIRSYIQLAHLEGRDFRLLVIDADSDDDTLPIIDTFRKQGLQIDVLKAADLAEAVSGALDTCYTYIPRSEQRVNVPEREIRMVDMRRRSDVCEYKTS